MIDGYENKPASGGCAPEKTRPRQRLQWIFSLLKITIGLGLILLLIISGRLNLDVIFIAYRHPTYFITGIVCCTAAFILPIFRWWILARIQMLPVGGLEALRLTMVGNFFNIFIPGSSGGDIIRAVYSVRACPERKAHALTVAFADRGIGLHAIVLVAVAAFFIKPALIENAPNLKPWLLLIATLLIAGIVIPLFLLWDRTNGFLLRLFGKIVGGADAWREALRLYRQQPGILCLAYLCSFGNVACNVLMIHYMMLAVGSTPQFMESLVLAPFIILANALPITPGGIGIAEAASAGLYTMVGQTGGANGMLLTRLLVIIYSMIGFPFFLLDRRYHPVASTLGRR